VSQEVDNWRASLTWERKVDERADIERTIWIIGSTRRKHWDLYKYKLIQKETTEIKSKDVK
jgi:hypothetical protein